MQIGNQRSTLIIKSNQDNILEEYNLNIIISFRF